jgi:D-beta-D-heptose 7-phosphate kinase/D-beta-D-heptose 1-phosphate adenosyltransferase
MATLTTEQAAQIARWKSAGEDIVFTNGVFDMLHPGHLAVLEAAARLGDVLIAGLNSDASARALGKGESRPVLDEYARRIMLEALRVVDMVVLFDEPTPLELIKLIAPDVLVKGEDYAGREVVGREIVEEAGGRVELVALLPGYSTTDLLARIRGGQ